MAPNIDEYTERPIFTTYLKHPSACSYNQDCQVCTDNFLCAGSQAGGPIAKVSETDARATIQRHVDSINSDYNALHVTLAAKGDKILARWRNSSKRRQNVIREAFGDLPTEKWAHLYAYMDSGKGVPSPTYREPFRQRFLLPYMTKEAFLQDPSRLMQLLFARTQHRPAHWAWTDHQLTRFGRHSAMLAARFSDTIFSTSRIPANYGKPEKFDTHRFHAWEQIGFPVAEILFEAQRDLYRILRISVELILKGADESATTNKTWLKHGAQAFNDLRPTDDNGTLIRVPIHPFGNPLQYDLSRMRSLVTERQSAIEDEIWLLQTDLVSAIQSVKAIQTGDFFRATVSAEKWPRIAFQLTQPLLCRARFWSPFNEYMNVVEFARSLPENAYETRQRVKQGRMLPLHLECALASTYELFSRYLKQDFSDFLANCAEADPYFDGTIATAYKSPKHNQDTLRWEVIYEEWRACLRNDCEKQRFNDDPILWILIELATLSHGDNHSMLEGVFPILEDILLSPKNYRQVDSGRLAKTRIPDILADFAAGQSIQSMLAAHQPKFWPLTTDKAEAFQNSELGRAMAEAAHRKSKTDGTEGNLYRSKLRTCWETFQLERYMKAGALLREFYEVAPSVEPKPSRYWRSKALEAKSALDAFWAEIRELEIQTLLQRGEKKGMQLTRATVEKWKDVRILDFYKDTEFVDAIKAALALDEAKTTQAATKRKIDEANEQRLLVDRIFEATLRSPTKKTKVKDDRKPPKRKDLPTSAAPQAPDPIQEPTPPPSPAKILASSDSMDILARMWPHESGTLDVGPARFTEVLSTMTDIGYPGAPTGGSVWRFSGPEGAINMHAPHGSLSAEVARGKLMFFGRQLKGRYGWGYRRFRERE